MDKKKLAAVSELEELRAVLRARLDVVRRNTATDLADQRDRLQKNLRR